MRERVQCEPSGPRAIPWNRAENQRICSLANRFKSASNRKRKKLPVSSIFTGGSVCLRDVMSARARLEFETRSRANVTSFRWSHHYDRLPVPFKGAMFACGATVLWRESAHRCVSTRPFTTSSRPPCLLGSSLCRCSGVSNQHSQTANNFTSRCKRPPLDNGYRFAPV